MRAAEYTSLAIFAGLTTLFVVDKAGATESHALDHYYEDRMETLSEIWFPPLVEGSVQFFVPGQGALYNSNTREKGERCKRQVGHDDGRWIIFEHCETEGTDDGQ